MRTGKIFWITLAAFIIIFSCNFVSAQKQEHGQLDASGSIAKKQSTGSVSLEQTFQNPTQKDVPGGSQLGIFWFWANTVTREGIHRDLEEMQHAGIRRVIMSMTRAHSATVASGGIVFLSPEWLALYRYALDEAERLQIKVSVVMSNGWYQGAPWVTPELGAQMLVWSETTVSYPAPANLVLPVPDKFRPGRNAGISPKAGGHIQAVAVLAYRQNEAGELIRESLVRLDDKLQSDGTLNWSVPDGTWLVFRFAHVPNFVPMKQDSPGFTGLQIDHLSAQAIEMFFSKVGSPLLEAAGPHVGKTFDFFHEDSMELGYFDWTGDLPAQFGKRRKYDLIPWLPVLAGKKFAGQSQISRIEHDFVTTIDEVLADEHYGRFRELCHQHGVKLETEGGDVSSSLRVKGTTDLPMGEFWNGRPKKTDLRFVENSNNLRAFNPNAVIASRIYGSGQVSFEAFTSAQHWVEYPAMLKPMADEVYCLGVNHLTLHGYSYSRPETPKPGDVYFAGTHFNPGITWWKYVGEFFTYLNRCQAMLNSGQPVVDLLYVDGPETQVMIQYNESRSLTALGKCDVIPGDMLISQLSVRANNRIGLLNGASYSVLAVANSTIEPEVLQKIVKLVNEGATVWFRTVPQQSCGWTDFPKSDKIIADDLDKLGTFKPAGVYTIGKGKVILGEMPVTNLLALIGITPAFSYTPDDGQPFLDFAQRQVAGADIYFVANWKDKWHQAECNFRVTDKKPELWNPVTGQIKPCPLFQAKDGVIQLSLQLPPNGSTFVVFREIIGTEQRQHPILPGKSKEFAEEEPAMETLAGPWRIDFNPAREGQPGFEISCPELFLWNESADPHVKAFAGSASYHKTFVVDSKDKNRKWILNLGVVHDLAEVFVNRKPAGVVWTPPFSVNLTPYLQSGVNKLEIIVTNTWNNSLYVDPKLPLEKRFTWTSVDSDKKPNNQLLPAGLIGPVTISN